MKAVAEKGVAAEVTHVTDLAEWMRRGVMVAPALAMDGEVESAGKGLKPADIVKLLG